jgi:hypothetical protein
MTKSLKYLMAAVMAGIFGLSITACSADYNGFDSNDAELIGTWDAISNQYYSVGNYPVVKKK